MGSTDRFIFNAGEALARSLHMSPAFLAGVAESQDALMLRPRGSLVAGRTEPGFATPTNDTALKLFVRQPLTESGLEQQTLIASVLARIEQHNGAPRALLKDLQNVCDVTYLEFEHADDLDAGLGDFFRRCARSRAAA